MNGGLGFALMILISVGIYFALEILNRIFPDPSAGKSKQKKSWLKK